MTKDSEFSEYVEQVHNDALDAIRSASIGRYSKVRGVYEEILLAIPEAWARYGQTFETTLVSELEWSSISPLHEMAGNLLEEMREAFRSGSLELGRESVGLSYGVALRALPLNAYALVRLMLDVLADGYFVAQEEGTDSLASLSTTYLMEFVQLPLSAQLTGDGKTIDERKAAARNMAEAFDVINEMLKRLVDAGSAAEVSRIDEAWGTATDWLLVSNRPSSMTLEDPTSMEVGYAPDGETQEQLVQAIINSQALLRFGLCYWALHRWEEQFDSEQRKTIFLRFASHFPDVVTAARAASLAIRRQYDEHPGPWTSWVLRDLPSGQAHSIGVETDLLRTFVFVAVLRTESGQVPSLRPEPWLTNRKEELDRHLETAKTNQALSTLVREPELRERADALKSSIAAAAKEQQRLDAEDLRRKSLDSSKVRAFLDAVREGYLSHRLAAEIFRANASYEDRPYLSGQEEGWYGFDRLLPKAMFTPDDQIHGSLELATEFGRGLAQGEMDVLVGQLAEAPAVTSQSSLRDSIHHSVNDLQRRGFRPSVAVASIDRTVQEEFDLAQLSESQNVPDTWSLGDGALTWLVGQTDGLALFEWPEVPANRLLVFDPSSYGRWIAFSAAPETDELLADIWGYDEAAARELADQNRELFSNLESQEERVLQIQEHVQLHIRIRFLLEVTRPDAVVHLILGGENSVDVGD